MADHTHRGLQGPAQFLDIEQIAAELRERVKYGNSYAPLGGTHPCQQTFVPGAVGPVEDHISLNLNRSREMSARILGGGLIGSIPPSPPTLRGWVGKKLIEIVRRCLFWLTPRIQEFQESTALMVEEHASALDELARRLSVLNLELARVRASAEQRNIEIWAGINLLERRVHAAGEDRGSLIGPTDALDQLAAQLAGVEEYGRSTRASLQLVQQRMASTGAASDARETAATDGSRTASSYFNYLAAFRGTVEDIKNRFRIYLDLLPPGELGSPSTPFVDLGCGRGEWLSLLRDRNLTAYGVDSNPALVRFCAEAGLLAQHDDLMMHLRRLPDESRGGFTGFHVVEHLPPGVLELMLDEFLRILIPGGIVILETPNPYNVFVSTRTFHNDPTHHKPIPPDLLRFLCEDRGFSGIQVLPLHPFPKEAMLNVAGDRAAQFIDTYFFGPQDYAVLCKKPHSAG
jgi:SAM-dependent methyltransferase